MIKTEKTQIVFKRSEAFLQPRMRSRAIVAANWDEGCVLSVNLQHLAAMLQE